MDICVRQRSAVASWPHVSLRTDPFFCVCLPYRPDWSWKDLVLWLQWQSTSLHRQRLDWWVADHRSFRQHSSMRSSPTSVETNRLLTPSAEHLPDPNARSMDNDDTAEHSCSQSLSFEWDRIPCRVFARSQNRSWSPDLSRHPKDTIGCLDSDWSSEEMKQRDMVWKERFSLRLTCVFNTVTLLPLQFTASSLMESTEGVCALIFNVLPNGRGSLLNRWWSLKFIIVAITFERCRTLSHNLWWNRWLEMIHWNSYCSLRLRFEQTIEIAEMFPAMHKRMFSL